MNAPNKYEFTVSLTRDVEALLKKEQGKRQSDTGKRISINSLASDILTQTLLEQNK